MDDSQIRLCQNSFSRTVAVRVTRPKNGKKSLFMNFQMTLSSKQIGHPIRVSESILKLVKLNRSHGSDNDGSIAYRPADYPGILDTDLTALTPEECLAFKVTVCVLCVLSLCGNISTLAVNSRRKMRRFFRACLISLALSDLMNTLFLTTAYMAQFSVEYVQIWKIGGVMCKLVPFATTAAILASSMTLVVIALDRYYAVMKAFVSFWNSSRISGLLCMSIIWFLSLGIASPVFWVYHMLSVYILSEVSVDYLQSDEETSWQAEASKENISYTLVKPEELVEMCVSDQKDVALYYIIVFSIIFIPCIVLFVWLNAVIAKTIWERRHRITSKTAESTGSVGRTELKSMDALKLRQAQTTSVDTNSKTTKISTITSNVSVIGNSPTKGNSASTTRETRHIRMVVVILLLIAVFICLRLPAWIFLLMRMYGSYTKPKDWITYFSLGILNLASCALNPLFYTYLHETIHYIIRCKKQLKVPGRRIQSSMGICKCFGGSSSNDGADGTDQYKCLGLLIGIFSMWKRHEISTGDAANIEELNVTDHGFEKPAPLSLEKDEGVECSDASYDEDDDEDDGYVYNDDNNENDVRGSSNQKIFTVFPLSLTSASEERVFD